jgi:HAE1 family hydrophobic/amphiphilic exporter-1
MFLSDISIRRPVAMSCLLIGLSLLGFNAYRKMGLELMPRMDLPYITVVTVYPGASPEQIETDIAKRIEDKVVTIDGLKHVSSACMENVCQTFLEFHLNVDVDIAATDVREKLDMIKADLPEDAEDPVIMKFDVNAKPVINMALGGDVSLEELYDYANNTLRDRLTVISGVADVELIGGAVREVHILLDREKLAERGLSSTDVVGAVRQNIRIIPSGRVCQQGTEYSVKFDADFAAVAEMSGLEVANEGGSRCYLRDIGRVEMTTKEVRQKAFIDGKSCISIRIIKKAEANAVDVVRRVRTAMETIQGQLPGGMDLTWINDDGKLIEATVSSAWSDIWQGVALTALILFLFLYNIRATLVIFVTMPLTIIIGLFFMQMCGYTLNTSTLLSIGLSVGVLVTNSIVVMEAIVKRLNATGNPKEASRLGAAESVIAVVGSAGTNIVVLFPLAMMSSMIGKFLRPLAWTMVLMTVVSLFISFTLTPLLCSLFLKPTNPNARGILPWMERVWNGMFSRVCVGLRSILEFNERHRWAAILVIVATIGLFVQSMSLGSKVGFGFFSSTDGGQLLVKLEFPTRYDLDKTTQRLQGIEKGLRNLPELKYILSTVGKVEGIIGQSSEGVYLAQILLRFSDRDERALTINDLMNEVRSRVTDIPECIATLGIPDFIGGQSYDIEMAISGDSLDTLDRIAQSGQTLVSEMKGFEETDTTVRIGKPEIRVTPQRAVLADMGVPAMAIGLALRGNLEGLDAGTFKLGARNYDIVVELEKRPGKDQVEQFLFPGLPGKPMLLSGLGNIEHRLAPVQITRLDKRRISKLLANIESSLPLGMAVDQMKAAINQKANMPPGYDYAFLGAYEIMAEAQVDFGEAGLISILLVYLMLAALLESFKQPWLILVTIPLALIGVMWALYLTGYSLSMFVLMSLIMMTGIVVNNAILITDQRNVFVSQGVPPHKAMIDATVDEFRPIVMITLAAILGMWPLATGKGIGAELRNDVGVASVGGILISGLLTVIAMPILYDLFTRRGNHATKPSIPVESSGGKT